MENYKKMIELAQSAMKNSYSPYSHFKVGACLKTVNGKYFVGTNIENSSYGASICAERSAISCAISSGEKNFEAIAIVSSGDNFCPPCGICRQVLSEFGDNIKVVLAKSQQDYVVYNLSELLPHKFFEGDMK